MHQTQLLTSLLLDKQSATPMFRQLYGAIKQAILSGKVEPGMQLPPTRDFCQMLDISRQTVLNAYAQLTAEGYLQGEVGRGTFISEELPDLHGFSQTPAAKNDKRAERAWLPLSARGQRLADAHGRMPFHQGGPRAFRVGMPGLDLFPFETWSRLEARRWRKQQGQLGYGDPAGFKPLRELLAVYLKAARGVSCTPEQIVITSGSQQALYLLPNLLLEPGDAAWMESPGYRGASAPLLAAQVKLCPVPVDEQGLQVQEGARQFPDAKLAYVTPSHQLPLGVTMSLPRRLELLAWAQSKRAWIIEDDYDSEYRYSGPTLASLQSLDRHGCVLYVGSLSKVLFPGLRLGYMVLPPALVDAAVQARAVMDKHSAIVPQMVLADFIAEGHFSRHIKRTREAYAERRHALLDALATQLPEHIRCGPSDAGLDLAVYFKGAHEETAVAQAGLELGVELRPLSHYAHPAGRRHGAAPGLLLGFASIPAPEIREGVRLLRAAMQRAGT